MKVTFKDICWFAVVALICLYLSKCHRSETDAFKQKADSIIEKLEQDSLSHLTEVYLLDQKLKDEQGRTLQALRESDIALAKLNISQSTVVRLTNALKAAKLFPVDTNFVTVAPEYVNYCDSLATESEGLAVELSRYKNYNSLVIAGKDRELLIKDSLIAKERMFGLECRKQFADLQTVYSRALDASKGKAQVYIGAEIIGTQTTFFQNVGGVLSLKTKGNKLWQISSGIQNNGQVYGRINGNILLSFKR